MGRKIEGGIFTFLGAATTISGYLVAHSPQAGVATGTKQNLIDAGAAKMVEGLALACQATGVTSSFSAPSRTFNSNTQQWQ
jgi:hypothetical protein